jgi:hypothetical protein
MGIYLGKSYLSLFSRALEIMVFIWDIIPNGLKILCHGAGTFTNIIG